MRRRQNYSIYALAAVAGVGVAVWTGVPWTFLLFLICPVMMFFMMRGMGGMSGGTRGADAISREDLAAKRSDASAPEGSRERVE